jgi:hypothetical protein
MINLAILILLTELATSILFFSKKTPNLLAFSAPTLSGKGRTENKFIYGNISAIRRLQIQRSYFFF